MTTVGKASFNTKLQILFGALLVGMGLIFPIFIAMLTFEAFHLVWPLAIGGSIYLLAVLISSAIVTVMGKIHMAFPFVATFLALNGMSLIFVLQLM